MTTSQLRMMVPERAGKVSPVSTFPVFGPARRGFQCGPHVIEHSLRNRNAVAAIVHGLDQVQYRRGLRITRQPFQVGDSAVVAPVVLFFRRSEFTIVGGLQFSQRLQRAPVIACENLRRQHQQLDRHPLIRVGADTGQQVRNPLDQLRIPPGGQPDSTRAISADRASSGSRLPVRSSHFRVRVVGELVG